MTKTAGSYLWKYQDDDRIISPIKINKIEGYYATTGLYYKSWNTLTEAAQDLGLKSGTNISAVISGKQKSAKGLKFKYANSNNEIEVLKINKIQAYNKNTGDFYKEFDSILEAAKDIGVHPSGITRVLSGQNKTSGGYTFRYKN